MQLSVPSRIALFLISLFVALTLSSLPAHAADPSAYTIHDSVKEVRIAFAASDAEGRVIKSLRSSDVAVADNGWIIRNFRSFRPAGETPLDVVLLLDISGSVQRQVAGEIADAKSVVTSSEWGARDRISMLVFGGMHPQVICVRNCRAAEAESKLDSLRADGDTPLYDALLDAAQILQQGHDPESRPAMILISDGMDSISESSLGDALHAAQDVQAPIYAVNSRSKKSGAGDGDEVLGYLTAGTGGLCFAPGQGLGGVLHAVLEDLHSGYVLTYEAPEVGGEHSVRILPTRDPRLQFRSRQSYNESVDE
jgi:VWFA-related protein